MKIFFLVVGSLPILGMSYDVRNVWEEQKRICKNKFVIYLETPSAALINPNLIKYENIGHGSWSEKNVPYFLSKNNGKINLSNFISTSLWQKKLNKEKWP